MPRFLADLAPRPLSIPPPTGATVWGLHLGQGPAPLEVVVLESRGALAATELQAFWKRRQGGRPAPLLVALIHGDKVDLCGPAGEVPPICADLEPSQAERVCREALGLPDRHAALRWLRVALPALESRLPGLRNEGLLALHELETVRRTRSHGWDAAVERAAPLLTATGESLLRGLGYAPEPLDQVAVLLRSTQGGRRNAVAVLLWPDEAAETAALRFNGLSPISWAMDVADRESVQYVMLLQGRTLRLYPTKIGVGVGRRGRGETYVEIHGDLLRQSDAALLWLLFSAEALGENGTLQTLLGESQRFAGELAERLRERIYDLVIPRLAEGLAKARNLEDPTASDLADTYGMAMTLLFRLLFIAYAEDKDLLPYKLNDAYRRRSLKQKALELLEERRREVAAGNPSPRAAGHALWDEVHALFDAVDLGNPAWGVPAYDGGLFTKDPALNRHGAMLEDVTLPDAVFAPALTDLLLIESPDGWGPVDFRSLNVGEFGTIYQGLLENDLAVAETDLAVDKEGYYRPAGARDTVVVTRQSIYLHNRSGQRKSTGSYYTKDFAVSHLLDEAMEPALKDHAARLDALDETAAVEAFFDFRVADLSMGSGHFLVAAVDRIERALTRYLARRPLPGVRAELARLRTSAEAALGTANERVALEDGQLLRRQIARRCIYGVDINRIAVDLARLSIWVHTFVPGLPLSLLDRNLVVGNSLVGIGQVEELAAITAAHAADEPLFAVDPVALVGDALEPLRRLARLADATIAEVAEARQARAEAEAATAAARALFDIATAARMQSNSLDLNLADWDSLRDSLANSRQHKSALKVLEGLDPFHYPAAFPEVFLRARPGFDVIVGNPPWAKTRLEENKYWMRHIPGLKAMAPAEQQRQIARLSRRRPDLLAGWEAESAAGEKLRDALRHMPGMATGHPDLFRAFTFRFTELAWRDGGWIAVVLPGDAFKIAGNSDIREGLVARSEHIAVQMLTNKAYWIFDDVDTRKLIAFLVARLARQSAGAQVKLTPEYHSRSAWNARRPEEFLCIDVPEWRRYSTTFVAPVLPRMASWEVIRQQMKAPVLGSHPTLKVRRVYADFETTRDRERWHEERARGDWPVYAGEAFDLWCGDTERYYAFTKGKEIAEAAHGRWNRVNRNSPFFDLPVEYRREAENHPVLRPRIAYRDVSNRTNTRTLVVALIPPKVVTLQQAPWVLFTDPNRPAWHEAYLLGVLSSLPLDWWARRFVEGHADQEAFDCLRVPDPVTNDPLRARVVALAGRLAAVDKRYEEWAKAVGVDCGPVPDNGKQDHIHELDAVVAHLYGLTEAQLTHIFETFHEGWDYEERLRATLRHFRAWAEARQDAPRKASQARKKAGDKGKEN